MACELEEAFDRARGSLPDEWFLHQFVQQSNGWYVLARPKNSWSNGVAALGPTLTKALNRLADRLEERA